MRNLRQKTNEANNRRVTDGRNKRSTQTIDGGTQTECRKQTHNQTNKQTNKLIHKQTDRQTNKQTNKQANKTREQIKQTNEQTNKQTNKTKQNKQRNNHTKQTYIYLPFAMSLVFIWSDAMVAAIAWGQNRQASK